MAYGYTFVQQDDGYRFTSEQSATGSKRKLPLRDLLLIAAVLVLLVSLTTQVGISRATGVLIAIGIGVVTMRLPARAEAPAEPQAGLLVTADRIVTEQGETIPVSRINSFDISNEADDYLAAHAGSQTTYRAGSGLAVAEAIGHGRRLEKAKTLFVVTAQHGPKRAVLMKRLDQSGANGLIADIRRVLQGIPLA